MKALVPIAVQDGKQAVNGRDLHAVLENQQDYTSWAKYQIDRAQLLEGTDFEVFTKKGENPSGGRPSKEYAFSIDAAKHIAMMSGTEKGKQVRLYFIEVEKQWKANTITVDWNDPDMIQQLLDRWKEDRQKRIAAETKIEADRPSTELGNALRYHNALAKVHQIAYALFNHGVDIGRNRLIHHLRTKGMINQSDALLSQRGLGLGIGENVPTGRYEYHENTIFSYTAFLNHKGIQMVFDDFGVSPEQRDAVLKDLTADDLPTPETGGTLSLADELGNDVEIN